MKPIEVCPDIIGDWADKLDKEADRIAAKYRLPRALKQITELAIESTNEELLP